MLNIGVIGLSDGNGHPYSWGAIFNGYDAACMEGCGYPVIPRYLEQQTWPDCRISDARVTSIWTQDSNISKKISRASLIDSIVDRPEQMIGKIDALLLARDDAENHFAFAEPFLKAGIPVYIDKPIALSITDLEKLYALERYPGQIFTCSALRFSKELQLTEDDINNIGEIKQIIAFTPKSWRKYAVHIIDPVIQMLKEKDEIVNSSSFLAGRHGSSGGAVSVKWSSGIETTFFATGDGCTPITIRVIGVKGSKDLIFKDTFFAFRAALEKFVNGVKHKTIETPRCFNEKVVKIIEAGM